MWREILCLLLGLILLCYGLEYLFSFTDDPREPPRLRSRFPLLGHPIGLAHNYRHYYTIASKKTSAEIYTLGVFNFKLYVCRSPRLLTAVQKESKTLSFKPFVQLAQHVLADAGPETYHLFGGEMHGQLARTTRSAMVPGPHLDEPNTRMGAHVLLAIDSLLKSSTLSSGAAGDQVSLLQWGRHAVLQASCCAVYGENHCFKNAKVEEALWAWQGYVGLHFVGADILGTGYALRKKVFDALEEYYRAFPQVEASQVAKERWRILQEAGIAPVEAAKQEISLVMGMTLNSAPTLYWLIWELFSRPSLLDEVRTELEAQAVSVSGDRRFALNVAAVQSQCPILLSFFEETQRHHHIHATVRKVMTDTVLDGKYLLKAGNYLQIPAQPMHMDPIIWGPTVAAFDPYRFLRKKKNGEVGSTSFAPHAPGSSKAFLAWGAPPSLCPGRQFAATELLVMVALLAMRADVCTADGIWEKNPKWNHNELHSVLNPKQDVPVRVSVRQAWHGLWSLENSTGRNRVPLTSG